MRLAIGLGEEGPRMFSGEGEERCEWCECTPCFLDCLDRRAQRPPEWRMRLRSRSADAPDADERKALLERARRMLRRGVEQCVVAADLGLRPDHVSVIAYRLRRGITGARRRH